MAEDTYMFSKQYRAYQDQQLIACDKRSGWWSTIGDNAYPIVRAAFSAYVQAEREYIEFPHLPYARDSKERQQLKLIMDSHWRVFLELSSKLHPNVIQSNDNLVSVNH